VGVTKKSNTVMIPITCPECDSSLLSTDVDLFCTNILCSKRQYEAINRLLTISKIPDGLGWSNIEKFLKNTHISSIFDLISSIETLSKLTEDRLKQVYQKHYGSLLHKLISSLCEKLIDTGVTYEEFWYFSNINNISIANSKKLKTINPCEIVDNLNNIRDLVPINTYESINKDINYLQQLSSLLKFNQVSDDKEASGIEIVMTGKLSKPRSKLAKELSQLGCKVVSSIGKETQYLLCNEPSNSSKFKEAEKRGVKIVTESEFYSILSKV